MHNIFFILLLEHSMHSRRTCHSRFRPSIILFLLLLLLGAGCPSALSAAPTTAVSPTGQNPGARFLVQVLAAPLNSSQPTVGIGVVLSPDGLILTPLGLVEDAHYVQVRFADGEYYDQAELWGKDTRRGLALIRVPARMPEPHPVVLDPQQLSEGEYVCLSLSEGSQWQTNPVRLEGMKAACDKEGRECGYRVLSFSCSQAPGSVGGAVMDGAGRMVGLLCSSTGGEGKHLLAALPLFQAARFLKDEPIKTYCSPIDGFMPAVKPAVWAAPGAPVPVEAVRTEVQKPTDKPAEESAASEEPLLSPAETLATANTITVASETVYFTPMQLIAALMDTKAIKDWKIRFLDPSHSRGNARLQITLDRPVFTFSFTWLIRDNPTDTILASGKTTAIDGIRAAPKVAEQIIEAIRKAREETRPAVKAPAPPAPTPSAPAPAPAR